MVNFIAFLIKNLQLNLYSMLAENIMCMVKQNKNVCPLKYYRGHINSLKIHCLGIPR